MLVLPRKSQESVVVGGTDGCALLRTVTVIRILGSRVVLGFQAAGNIRIWPSELQQRMPTTDQQANRPATNEVAANEVAAKRDDREASACLERQRDFPAAAEVLPPHRLTD